MRKPTSEETALVVCHKKVIEDYMHSNFTFGSPKRRKIHVDSTAYHYGRQDAEKISLDKQINQ